MGSFRPRHYVGRGDDSPFGVVQEDKIYKLRESILRLAHEEYDRQGFDQSFEVIQRRQGFGVHEVIRLLADHVERLKAENARLGGGGS